MAYKCAKTINISVFGSVLLLTIPAGNYFDNEHVNIYTAQAIPAHVTSDMTVNVQLGDSGPTFPMQQCGHHVYADQIRINRCYATLVATDTGVFTVTGGGPLCKTAHVNPPVLTAPAPAPDDGQ